MLFSSDEVLSVLQTGIERGQSLAMLRSQLPLTLSNKTRLFTFSLLFPLDHFFFLPLLELAAALAMASLDLSGTLGGCFVVFRSVSRTFLLRLRHQ